MTSNLLHDNYDASRNLFKFNINISRHFGRPEYEGFALMDYAKGIYHIDLQEALNLLRMAHKIFCNTGQLRREIDCLCEIYFLEEILYGGRIVKLINQSKMLRLKNLTNQYVKSLLKIAACSLISNIKDKDAVKHLIEKALIANNDLENPRVEFVIANLYCILSRSSKLNMKRYSNLHRRKVKHIGKSYGSVAEHNHHYHPNSSNIQWYTISNQSSQSMLIDPRIW